MEKLKDKASVDRVIAQMNIREKIEVLTGSSLFFGKSMEKYGIPSIYYLDGGTGANYFQMYLDCFCKNNEMTKEGGDAIFDVDSEAQVVPMLLELEWDKEAAKKADPALQKQLAFMHEKMKAYIPGGVLPGCFPPGILLGSTWDAESVREVGVALGAEANYYGIDVLLGTPNVNIHRDPLGGRVFEGYSEDPCLTAALAPELVKGVQESGVLADVKHFAANNQETDRRGVNEMIPARALQEIYFPGFKACVKEGGCKTVMSSYNAINGVPSAHNHWLLTEVLRDDWGFEGFVVSDWGGAYDQAKAFAAGNDVDMPGPRDVDKVVCAVQNGELSEEAVDTALRRYLGMVLESPAMTGRKTPKIDIEASEKAAYRAAAEGMVLLKNEGGVLPLSENSRVSFFGEKSKKFIESGGGSANVITDRTTNLFDCTADIIGRENVAFETIGKDTDAVIITVGVIGQEGFDRADMEIEAGDKKTLMRAVEEAKAAGKKVIVVLNVCGPVRVSEFIGSIDALLCVFIPGMEGGRAAADILFGRIVPSGKLPLTFPKEYKDCPTYGNFPGRDKEVWYAEGIMVGYRYYDFRAVEPMFPFGFGLSYTNFELSGPTLSADRLDLNGDGETGVRVRVKNTGSRAGKEVVQLYIAHIGSTLIKPPKELKAFQKVFLEAGEEKTVTFTLRADMLKSYDLGKNAWLAEPGRYEVIIATSSRDIRGCANIEAFGYNPYGVDENTTLGQLVIIPGALDELLRHCPVGALTRQSVEMSILFAATGALKDYWQKVINPMFSDLSAEEKEERYQNMLRAMNKFHS